jgi:ATP-binding protein involved in chromosome partitioning
MQPQGAQPKVELPNIKYILAVASGKGGVGKSTVSTNLALALAMQGRKVGLMDADIYGPSVPIMMGLPEVDARTTPMPVERYGLKLMSMGFLTEVKQAAVLRGPMIHRYLIAFLTQVDWGTLDFLVIDLPPGTGDAQLSLSQSAPVTGSIVVVTPQEVALTVARKGIEMFRTVRVPILGVVENMSYFLGDDGKRYTPFGSGGGKRLADEYGVALLGELPIDSRVAECSDAGEPIVRRHPDSPISRAYLELATAVQQELTRTAGQQELPEAQL